MTITNRIEVNPGVMLGKPVIRGTRAARSSLGVTVVSVVAEFGGRLRTAFVVIEPGRARLSKTI